MRVRGHTLVWHSQTPAWVFTDAERQPDDADAGEPGAADPAPAEPHPRRDDPLRGRRSAPGTWSTRRSIESQPDGFRRSPWFNIIGPEYIDIAFQAAREVAPTAKLYYQRLQHHRPDQARRSSPRWCSGMKSRGVPIDGVGHQMHNNVDFPSGAGA